MTIINDILQYCSVSRKLDKECGGYCYTIVKPLLQYAASIRSKEAQFNDLTNKIQSLEATIKSLENQLEIAKQFGLAKLEIGTSKNNTENPSKELEIMNLKSKLLAIAAKIEKLEEKLAEMEVDPNVIYPSSCMGKTSGIYKLKVKGSNSFSVQCDSSLVDSGQ